MARPAPGTLPLRSLPRAGAPAQSVRRPDQIAQGIAPACRLLLAPTPGRERRCARRTEGLRRNSTRDPRQVVRTALAWRGGASRAVWQAIPGHALRGSTLPGWQSAATHAARPPPNRVWPVRSSRLRCSDVPVAQVGLRRSPKTLIPGCWRCVDDVAGACSSAVTGKPRPGSGRA